MIRIEVKDATVEDINGVSQRTGKPFHLRKQSAYAHLPGEAYPVKIELALGDQQAPYAVGDYVLSPESLYVDRFRNLSIGRLVLSKPASRAA